jgi:hypothetical protein
VNTVNDKHIQYQKYRKISKFQLSSDAYNFNMDQLVRPSNRMVILLVIKLGDRTLERTHDDNGEP